jgi:hypothetical protein
MSGQRDTNGYRHGMRVRLGSHGPTGKLLHCEKKDKSGWYWKVKLDSGEWVWPADLHIDGKGDSSRAARTAGCRFSPPPSASRSAPTATRPAHGTKQRAQEPSDYHGLAPRGPARRSI